MLVFMQAYIRIKEGNESGLGGPTNAWTKASMNAARDLGYIKKGSKTPGERKAWELRKWVHDFIADREEIPICDWKTSGQSLIDNEDFAQEIHTHLQTLKPSEVCVEAIVRFLDDPEMLSRLKRKKTILVETAQHWLAKMGYRWTYDPKGQYADGHERSDVVDYRNNHFLPAMAQLQPWMTMWTSKDGERNDPPGVRHVVVWYHDESTFYAYDRRRKRWVHKDEKAKPYAKGEGHSLMVADFYSAEYGWLQSRDGKKRVRVLFRAGKACDGYFDNDNVRTHLAMAMEILTANYSDEEHVFVFDNAKTHSKRPEGSQSAMRMTKGPSANFFVEVNDIGDDRRLQYSPDGKILKKKIPMSNGRFADGQEQQFYWPADCGNKLAGQFKGMVWILEERGYVNVSKKKAQCGKKFSDCSPGKMDCCCRRMVFSKPNFMTVESILEAEANSQGFRVLFLPKFHCELNPIEQCWGYAKRNYWLLPASSSETDLENNVVKCLDEIPLITMRRYGVASLI